MVAALAGLVSGLGLAALTLVADLVGGLAVAVGRVRVGRRVELLTGTGLTTGGWPGGTRRLRALAGASTALDLVVLVRPL